MKEPKTLRERKKARTRREVAAAAVRLFTERGFTSVTIEEIAEEAMVSVRTVQRYFGTKADIAFADHAENLAVFRDTVAEELAAGAGLAAALHAAGLATANMSLASELAVQRRLLIEREPALSARWLQNGLEFRDVIAQAIAAETNRPPDDFRVLLASGAIHGALRAGWTTALKAWAQGAPIDPDPIFETLANFIERGLESLLGEPASVDGQPSST